MSLERKENIAQTVLAAFIRIARHLGADLSLATIVHKYAIRETEVSGTLLKRIASDSGFKLTDKRLSWESIIQAGNIFPALGMLVNGRGVILSGIEVSGDAPRLAYVDPSAPGAGFIWVTQSEWAEKFSGVIYLVRKKYSLSDENQPFGLKWFAPELLRHKGVFRDVAINAMVLNVLTEVVST